MTQEEQQEAFITELRNLGERFAREYDLTYQSLMGCLTDYILDLKLESKYSTPIDYTDDGEYEEYENEDDPEEDDGESWKTEGECD